MVQTQDDHEPQLPVGKTVQLAMINSNHIDQAAYHTKMAPEAPADTAAYADPI